MTTFSSVIKHLIKADKSIYSFITTVNDPSFYLHDQAGNIYKLATCKTPDACFKVKNKTSKNIGFIPVDGKTGYIGCGISCCDTILFNNKYFCFIEFKLNATSLKPNAVKRNRKKAIKQLGRTISYFNTKLHSNYLNLFLEAHISTPPTYPRADTKWKSYRIAFFQKFHIPLFESNEKRF